MKIYFCGSIRGGQQDVAIYRSLISGLRQWGDVLTEHDIGVIADPNPEPNANDQWIHDRDLEWLRECDVVVAEVTTPSLGVGYELGVARILNKPVTCLFRPSSGRILSGMVRGAINAKFSVVDYDDKDENTSLTQLIDEVVAKMTGKEKPEKAEKISA